MKQRIRKCLCLLLAGILLLSLSAPAWAAEEADTLHLYTAEDLEALSRACTLDSWSRGKTVILEADIDLTGTDFSPIPTFGGCFEGRGHTISGLSLTGSGNVRGLFRYVQSTGVVRDLTVEGSISPSGRKNTLGGLVGQNSGLLTNCAFTGSVSGKDSIGGLVGINEAGGQIVNCTFSGAVTGEHYVGGIAGQNLGTVIRCQNSGNINTTEVETELSLDEVNREQLNAAENVPVCTDIGGIAGFSSGILQSCVNSGAVGYAHVGYNIGGITGRQSGYLNGCTNSGAVLGRKDVGGIAGQLEPEVRLLYNGGQMGDLLDELEVLQDRIDQTRRDVRGISSDISAQMQTLSDRTEEARGAVSDLADAAADWADENIDAVNSVTARLSWLSDEMVPLLEDGAEALDLAETLAEEMDDLLDDLRAAGKLGTDAAAEGENVLRDLHQCLSDGRTAMTRARAALEHLQQALGKREDTLPALEELFAAVETLAEDCAGAAASAARALDILWSAGGLEGITPEEKEALTAALADLQNGFSQVADALPAAGAAIAGLVDALDSEELAAALEEAEAAGEALAAAVQALAQAADSGRNAAADLQELLAQLGSGKGGLDEAGETAGSLMDSLSDLGWALYDLCREWAEQPAISFRPMGSELREREDALGEAFSALLADGSALQKTMTDAADTLLDDLDGIGSQFSVILDRLRKVLEGSGESVEDRFEDVSDQETGAADTGSLSGARNTGSVEGDINVGGIVGSMAIEYDFDPEDDLVREGDRSLDVRYQTRAVVTACVNSGEVTGKQDYVGGVAGLMDLGRVSGCESYGAVSSTNGDYVGGIAGASWGSIRGCWSKGCLSGGDYIGGVAGLGATIVDCHTLITIDEGAAYLGAVAGSVDSGGTVSGNSFTSESLGALDGISYAGQAEPVDFDTLCATSGAPEGFSQLELTFVAEGRVIAVIPFLYGQGIESLPEIPAKEGYSAAWPELDYTHLTVSQTLEAVYTPYSSALTDDGGELPEILVDGSFSSRAVVSHTAEEVSWTDQAGQHSGTAYTVTVEDPDLAEMSYTVHVRLPDPDKRYSLWIREGEEWQEAEGEIDGHYLLVSSREAEITFCVTERSGAPLVWIAAAAAVLITAAAVYYLCRIRPLRREKAREKAG